MVAVYQTLYFELKIISSTSHISPFTHLFLQLHFQLAMTTLLPFSFMLQFNVISSITSSWSLTNKSICQVISTGMKTEQKATAWGFRQQGRQPKIEETWAWNSMCNFSLRKLTTSKSRVRDQNIRWQSAWGRLKISADSGIWQCW